jgi:hypothetical protein
MLFGMASMDSVHQKMYRARDHYVELREKLVAYYAENPGEFFVGPGSSPTNPQILYREKTPLPKRFGLMFGDCIQCIRSSLDYLVHELVELEQKPHHLQKHKQNQFPIAMTQKAYKEKMKANYLEGVDSKAEAIIYSLQPLTALDPGTHPLVILDKLANINKHRRVILTNFVSTNIAPSQPLQFPHIRGVARGTSLVTGQSFDAPVWAYVTIKDELIQDEEIITAIENLWGYVNTKVFPLFEDCFV